MIYSVAHADGAHAGLCLETPEPINAAMDSIIRLQVGGSDLPKSSRASLNSSDRVERAFKPGSLIE